MLLRPMSSGTSMSLDAVRFYQFLIFIHLIKNMLVKKGANVCFFSVCSIIFKEIMTSLDFLRQFNRLDFMPSLGLGLMHALNGTMGNSKNSNQIDKIYLCKFISDQISISCDHSQVAIFKNYYHGGLQYAILINCTHNPNPLHQLICAKLSLISSGAFYCIHKSKTYLSLTKSPPFT